MAKKKQKPTTPLTINEVLWLHKLIKLYLPNVKAKSSASYKGATFNFVWCEGATSFKDFAPIKNELTKRFNAKLFIEYKETAQITYITKLADNDTN